MSESTCHICEGNQFRRICVKQDIPIFQCRGCGSAYAKLDIINFDLETLYDRSYFHNEEPSVGYRDYDRIADLKRSTFQSRLTSIEKLSQTGRLLDIGCATGLFVDMASERGWDATGIDVSAFAVQQAQKQKRGTFKVADLITSTFASRSFHVITMFDVIEHVRRPIDVLRRASSLLHDQGLLVVETPNVEGLMAKVMGRRWPYYRPPEHLFYFSPKSLKLALEKSHFEFLYWTKSFKTMTVRYIVEMLQLTNPEIADILSHIFGKIQKMETIHVRVPTGSFLAFARVK